MIRALGIEKGKTLVCEVESYQLITMDLYDWYWVDLENATEEEITEVGTHFQFHQLAIEDSLHMVQRPKWDNYNDYQFIVINTMNANTSEVEEIDFFLSGRMLVTIHSNSIQKINDIWEHVRVVPGARTETIHLMHGIVDHVVDAYFPFVYKIEDELNTIEDNPRGVKTKELMDKLSKVRNQIKKMRRTISPMKELVYRLIESDKFDKISDHKHYFNDVYDHLLRLSEMTESSQEISIDIRENYISTNAHQMNSIMMVLTVFTTIFMPLTFIVGIYGMNFDNMPELHWRYSYLMVWLLMIVIAVGMFILFKKKGWFGQK
jgi:magnesium transporter